MAEPSTQFLIGTSDYTDRVIRYGTVKRTANDLRAGKMTVDLANYDGHFNTFYTNLYTIAGKTGTFKIGYSDSSSYNPSIRNVFVGKLRGVEYDDEKCKLTFRDNLDDLSQRIVGASDVPVTFADTIPTNIFWTLCTCYGGLSNVASTSNTEIDYTKFLATAAQFSGDSIINDARYTGQKVTECLARLAEMNAGAIYCNGENKICFERFFESSSLDTVIDEDDYEEFNIDIEKQHLVNRQWVFGAYNVESRSWGFTCCDTDLTSINTFGIHEQVLQDEHIWFPDSVYAINRAQREVYLYNEPPKLFDFKVGLFGLNREIAETVKFVNSFFDITSAQAFRITEWELDMNTGMMKLDLDSAANASAFYLDYSYLDFNDRLL